MSHVGNWLTVKLRPALRYSPTFEVFRGGEDVRGDCWYYRERSSNGQVAGTGGEAYASRWNAKRAAYAHAARIDGSKVRVLD